MMKTAKVTQVDFGRGMVKVVLPELDNSESEWLALSDTVYDMPPIGSQVMVTFDENNYSTGICHGNYFNETNPPLASGAGIFYQRMAGDMVLKYDANTKILEITAANVKINGNMAISGNLNVTGNVTAANFP